MPPDLKVQIAGLHVSNNPFSTAPPGALAVADNCVLGSTNVLEPRRGFAAKTYSFGGGSDRASVLTWYGSTLLVQYASKLARDTGAAFTDYTGTFAVVDATRGRIRFAAAASNLYFNCSDGLRVLDSVTGTPVAAGVPRALRTTSELANANGWLAHDTAVAYRAVWGFIDANGNEKLGVPGGRTTVINYVTSVEMSRAANVVTVNLDTNHKHYLAVGNTFILSPGDANFAGGTYTVASVIDAVSFTYAHVGANVALTGAVHELQRTRSATFTEYIPAGITTSHFFQVYRSEATDGADVVPSDELFLCYESKPTAGEITAGFLTVTDSCTEEFLGDAAPWNANDGYGLVQANERPPISLDLVADWDSRTWFGNTTERHRLFIDLLGIGSPNGLQVLDTLTIGATVYTAAGNFSFVNWGTPAQNIEATARSLVAAINAAAGPRAYYVSGEDDVPGRILLEETGIGGAAFTVSTSRASAFNPVLTRTSDNNRRANALKFSKPGQPEAVPTVNEVLVGSRNDAILRAVPLKSAIIVFKETEGIWQVTGTNGRYTAERIGVAKLLSPESVQVFADKVWAFTDQGETTVTEGSGVSVVSYNIETDLLDLPLAYLKTLAFGVGYEAERRYLLWLPDVALSTTVARQTYCYSTATKAFTRWTKGATCGGVDPYTGLLHIAPDSNTVLYERKAYTSADYADETFAVSISSVASSLSVVLASVSGITVGDALVQGASSAVVTAINTGTKTLTLATNAFVWTVAAATIYPAIASTVTWQPVTAGNPASTKLARACTFLLGASDLASATASFSSERNQTAQPVVLDFTSDTTKLKRVAPLPKEAAEAAQLTVTFAVREAFAAWKLHGFVVDLDAESEKTGRR